MRHNTFALLICLLWACGGGNNSEQGALVRISYQLDTVMVNPGQEILFLNSRLYSSLLSEDKRYLYNFNRNEFAFEKIDLDELAFKEMLPFSKEGPDGVGEYFMSLLLLDDAHLLISGYDQDNICSWDGKRTKHFSFRKVGAGDKDAIKDGESFYSPSILPDQPEIFYGIVNSWQEKTNQLMVLDLEHDKAIRMDVPILEKLSAYDIEFNDGQVGAGIGSTKFVIYCGGRILLGGNATSQLYEVDPTTFEWFSHDYEPEIVPKEKVGKYENKVSDKKLFESIYKKSGEEISYLSLVWDEVNERYYRFSQLLVFEEGPTKEDEFLPQPIGSKVFLCVYDKELKLIAESLIPELNQPLYNKYFAKDGKIWIFENVEDEMGFIQMEITSL
ncbi:DUF4221 family protein [Pleomorphovibrio marinus]|uniref:DUF4221 family protein n=1 Tax=Pleomorphovibrio marinus TaxID=2164132 RepID=UPI000E0AFD57|nr:DUF4221 family protein [Pleomorphovibrio marinus]